MTNDADELGRLAALARALPREVSPPADLWERIAACLEPRDRLDQLAAALPAEIDPPAELWPAIEARIARKPRAQRRGLAAAAGFAAAALVAVGVWQGSRRDSDSERGSAPVVAGAAEHDAASVARNAGWILSTPGLVGDVGANLSRELALVRDERLSIERAIAKEPDNADLRELWAFTYETELRLADAAGRTVMEYERDRG